MNIDPDLLTDNQWVETWVGLKWILETQADQLKKLK